MKLATFLRSFRGQQISNRLLVVVCILLASVALVQALDNARQSAVIALVPPTLREEARLEVDESSPSYKTAWGLFFAQLVGNVTPSRVSFIRDILERFVSPAIFQSVIQRLEVEGETIKRDQIAIAFEVKTVQFDAARNLVIVEGVSIVRPAIGKEKRGPRTYEFEIDIMNYRPVLRDMVTYEGPMKLPETRR